MCDIIDFETKQKQVAEQDKSFEQEFYQEWEAGLDAASGCQDVLQEAGIMPTYAALSGMVEGIFVTVFANSPSGDDAREMILEALNSVGKFDTEQRESGDNE